MKNKTDENLVAEIHALKKRVVKLEKFQDEQEKWSTIKGDKKPHERVCEGDAEIL